MRRVSAIVLLINVCFCANVSAAEPEEIYRKANVNYENENYKRAVSLYEDLAEMDKMSFEVYYNLGNGYFKLKDIGRAILNYERALRLAPRDSDIRANLRLANSMKKDKIDRPEMGFIPKVFLFPYNMMSVNELTLSVSLLFYLIVIFLIFSVFLVAKRKNFFYTIGALFLFFMFSLILLAVKIHDEHIVKRAIVMDGKVDVRSGPKEDYLLQFSLHEGTKIKIAEERQNWYEIDLSNDLKGWLPKDTVEII